MKSFRDFLARLSILTLSLASLYPGEKIFSPGGSGQAFFPLAANLAGVPGISQISPAPGFVDALASISVVFNEPVTGVRAGDFLVNGIPAENVTGTGASYTFGFSQPAFGPVDISWGTLHTIADLDTPPTRFDGGIPGSTWAYQLIDRAGPGITNIVPVPGTELRRLGAVEVSFSRPVDGVDASDLTINGVSATNVVGVGAGPYRFSFPEAVAGEATIDWAANHGIKADEAVPITFSGDPWKYRVNPAQPPPNIVINEILAENQTGLVDEEKILRTGSSSITAGRSPLTWAVGP